MAYSAINPQVLSWPAGRAGAKLKITAEDSKTWKKGQLGYLTSGTVTPVSTSGITTAYCIMLEDQDTSTSSTDVWVQELVLGMRLLMFVQTNGTASAISASSNLGTKYGVENISNVTYLDLGTASGQFKVVRLASDAWPYQSNIHSFDGDSGVPGICIAEFSEA